MRVPKITTTFNSSKRRGVFVVVPLLILLVDYSFFPVIWDTYRYPQNADITYLLTHQTQPLGSVRGHHIHLSMDDILDPKFLGYLKQPRNALVISVFTDAQAPASGALLRAVMQKLQKISPNDYRKLVDRLKQQRSLTPGDTISFSLALPTDKYHEFPVDYLFLLVCESGNLEKQDLDKGIKRVLDLAQKEKISSLVLPGVGINWEARNLSGKFDEFFGAFFTNLSATDRPLNIYLSLYTQWPSFVLEAAIASVNSSWDAGFQKPNETSTLYRGSFRLIMLFLCLCLFVSSFFATLTLANFFVISLSFVGSAIGSNKLVDFFTEGYPPSIKSVLKIIVLTVLAFGFPFIVGLSPQKIFKKDEN